MVALGIAVAIVIVVSAICSLLEAVLYAVPASHIESLAQQGKASGRILRTLRQEVDAPITAILSLNTIANTAGAAIAGVLAARALGEGSVGYFSAALTLAILLLSEVIPKTAGVVYARPVSSFVARPLQWMTWLFRPMIWLCGLVTRLMFRNPRDQGTSPAELLVMARAGRRSGTIEESEGTVIENALTLKDRLVRDVMTPRTVVFAVPATERAGNVFGREELRAHSRFPVYEDRPDTPVGLVYSRDVLAAVADDRPETTLSELMRPIRFVADGEPLDGTLTRFLRQPDHLMAVVGEFGGFAGVITLEDVLEELLGREIVDETDAHEDLRELARQRRERVLGEDDAG